MSSRALAQTDIDNVRSDAEALRDALSHVLIGQPDVVRDTVVALLAGGHFLLEGLPGLGKTQLAKAVAVALGAPLARVQGTPDLMPFDITGSEMLRTAPDGSTALEFVPGPVFSSLLLLDEVNRTPPKTQAALLEAMQEGQVSVGGETRSLPHPFIVMATQNMIEFEGTYPLPEAQLDRFIMKIVVPYPSRDALVAMAGRAAEPPPAPVIDLARLLEMRAIVKAVAVGDHVMQSAVDLVLQTHRGPEAAPEINAHVAHGASPRALQCLLRCGAAHALLEGRAHLARPDIAAIAAPVLRHRVLLDMSAHLDGVSPDNVVAAALSAWLQDEPVS